MTSALEVAPATGPRPLTEGPQPRGVLIAVRNGDRASNFWPPAVLSFGESWHHLHHADPTCARHGVLRGQVDISARLIWLFEKTGAAWNVRWPNRERLAAKMIRS